ncbi:hypothetical protein RRF57_008001 [Xylaria bambusicola]|uniref:Uncharacterized protein n=1 Tax=Xylaria bambusicola TaxID=326684 RepID=A0AAN7Z7X0_9PEZI
MPAVETHVPVRRPHLDDRRYAGGRIRERHPQQRLPLAVIVWVPVGLETEDGCAVARVAESDVDWPKPNSWPSTDSL